MNFRSQTLPEFWLHYDALPKDVRRRASKQYAIFKQNPRHPSLQLKPVGALWSVRITEGHRALAIRQANTFTWFWIGSHGEYERMLKDQS